jgi:16S rRNA (guanine966-N2)-methyltransferase
MRIVAGQFRGRAILSPEHGAVRPTSDRVRESVFNILAHGLDDFNLAGARVIDLFAGTGALGLEAISRGAGYCLFVEDDANSRGLIRSNVETFGLTGVTRIFRRDATSLGLAGTLAAFDLAFLDPPYGKGLAEKALVSLQDGAWLTPGAIVVVEEAAASKFNWPSSFNGVEERTYGNTKVYFGRVAAG